MTEPGDYAPWTSQGQADRAPDAAAPGAPWPPDGPSAESIPRPGDTIPVPGDDGAPVPRRPRAGGRAAIVCVFTAIAVAAAVLVLTRHPGAHPPRPAPPPSPAARRAPSPAPPALTKPAAQDVLMRYVQVNNEANQSRSAARLSSIEARSSWRIDAGAYRWTRITDPANHGYVPLAVKNPVYYIPRFPAGAWPRWWVAHVTWVTATPRPAARGTGWLLFTQAAANAPWKDVLEPYDLPHAAAPAITLDHAGYATALSPPEGVAVPAAAISAQTAAALAGTGHGVQVSRNLSPLLDQSFWRQHMPAGSGVTQTWRPSGPVYGLATSGGGALLLYPGTSQLTLTPPRHKRLGIRIPGYYSARHPVTIAKISYALQFAAIDPPGHGQAQVIADTSGIAGRG
jgi:hypothetical protein